MNYKKQYQVNYYNCDESLKLSVSSLLRFFEDLAITHSEASRLGFNFYTRNNVAWFLTRWHVKIESLPRMGEVIEIITTPKSFNNFYANREYDVFTEAGVKIISANTLWVFLDAKSRKPKRVPEEVYHGYGLEDDGKKYFSKLEEIKPIEKYIKNAEFKILRRDLDYNNHVNNSVFVSLAFELIPPEIQNSSLLEDLSVNYLHEAYLDDVIQAEYNESVNDGRTVCVCTIKRKSEVLCRVKTGWKRIS